MGRLLVVAAAVLALAATGVGAERHVAAASGHVCVLTPGDNVECSSDSDFPTSSNKTTVPIGIPFMAVTAGDTFSCGLGTADGAVTCWGEFPGGAAPSPATHFIDIHAGANNLCGLQAAGTVLCYGNASAGVTAVPAGVYQSVSTGTDVACAVRRDHTVACWGDAANPVHHRRRPRVSRRGPRVLHHHGRRAGLLGRQHCQSSVRAGGHQRDVCSVVGISGRRGNMCHLRVQCRQHGAAGAPAVLGRGDGRLERHERVRGGVR